MNKPGKRGNVMSKGRNDVDTRPEYVGVIPKPALYSSIVQTETQLRRITISDTNSKQIANKAAGVKEVNFPFTQQVYDYNNMVDVGLNSGVKVVTRPKPKLREVHSTRKPEPKLSDYYRPSFNNVQRIQMDGVTTTPELTVQFDGLAVSRLINQIDDLVFK